MEAKEFVGELIAKARVAQKAYEEKFPNIKILGYAIDSLNEKGEVDEAAVDALFKDLDDAENRGCPESALCYPGFQHPAGCW